MHVEIVGFERGARKVSCTDLLRASAGLGLAEAHALTTTVIEGKRQMVSVSSEKAADKLVSDLRELGFVARVADGHRNHA